MRPDTIVAWLKGLLPPRWRVVASVDAEGQCWGVYVYPPPSGLLPTQREHVVVDNPQAMSELDWAQRMRGIVIAASVASGPGAATSVGMPPPGPPV